MRISRKYIRKAEADVQRFQAIIPVDPKGYQWVNDGMLDPVLDDEYYADGVFLNGLSHDDWLSRLTGIEPFEWEQTYDPFIKEPALFRIFAALPESEEAIVAFANKYGDIQRQEDLIDEQQGRTLESWRLAIERMREAVVLADEFSSVQETGKTTPRTVNKAKSLLESLLRDAPVYLTAVQQNGGVGLRIRVVDLIDAMNLQLAASIVEHKRYRTCEQCDKPFEVTPQVNRADRLFCSDNCRVKSYQRRKKQAIAQRQQGKTLRDIVKATGSDLETVKRWVQAVERKQK